MRATNGARLARRKMKHSRGRDLAWHRLGTKDVSDEVYFGSNIDPGTPRASSARATKSSPSLWHGETPKGMWASGLLGANAADEIIEGAAEEPFPGWERSDRRETNQSGVGGGRIEAVAGDENRGGVRPPVSQPGRLRETRGTPAKNHDRMIISMMEKPGRSWGNPFGHSRRAPVRNGGGGG